MFYEDCILCPNLCHVDRRNETGICRQKDTVRIAWSGLHRGEEPPVTGEHGSGMIFFTGCPLHCQFCQNRQISGSDGENYGIDITVDEMARLMLSLQDMGAATLNLVTGTHFIPSIVTSLEEAKRRGFSLPVVWNSSGYERPEALSLIDKHIDIYLLDCKTLSHGTASRFCGRKEYADAIIPVMEYVKKTHPYTDMDKMRGTILRHLVFPGELKSTFSFLSYFAKHYKDSFYLSLMTQFVPPLGNPGFEKITDDEYNALVDMMEVLGIDDGFMQDPSDDDILWIPEFMDDVPFPESFADPCPYFLAIKHR